MRKKFFVLFHRCKSIKNEIITIIIMCSVYSQWGRRGFYRVYVAEAPDLEQKTSQLRPEE